MTTKDEARSGLVFIPAAGLGSRVAGMGISKPLMSIGDQPLIWRIMDLYPSTTRFVVAVGYEGKILTEVVQLYARMRGCAVSTVQTNSYTSKGGGLSQTLRDSASLLQEPFVFHACDTFMHDTTGVLASLLERKGNVALSAIVEETAVYRSFSDGAFVKSTLQPGESAYIGVAKISDWEDFWSSFEVDSLSSESEDGESVALRRMTTQNWEIPSGTWLDAGSPSSLSRLRSRFSTQGNILPKSDETIWLRGERMIKAHKSTRFISGRIERSQSLAGFVPECQREGDHLFSYERIPGNVLSDCNNDSCFQDFLDHCRAFWELGTDSPIDGNFGEFYKDKTLSRVSDYLEKHGSDEHLESVNGSPVANVRRLLGDLAWDFLCNPLVGYCHGDLHPENVIHDHSTGKFTFLDWRQDIGGSKGAAGDVYYDLAKILHGLMVDHGSVSHEQYSIESLSETDVTIRIALPNQKRRWITGFVDYLGDAGFDIGRVWQLTALVFLNIATLHHEGYDRFLFSLGVIMLSSNVNQASDVKEFVDLSGIFCTQEYF